MGRFLAFFVLVPLMAQAQPASTCPSFAFTVEKNGAHIPFDVAVLRRERSELYQILRQRVVQDLYYGQEQSNLTGLVSNAYQEISRRGAWPKDEDQQKRLLAFYVHGVLGAAGLLEKLKFECASFVDGIAAELSLVLSKEEGERLLGIVTNPLHEKFLVFMLRSKSTHKVPEELGANINTRLLKSFNEGMIDLCKQGGVAADVCEKFQVRPPQTAFEHYSALIEKEQQQRGFRCASVNSDSRKFIMDDLPALLVAARENKKLEKGGEVASAADKLAAQSRECERLEGMARAGKVNFEGNFRKISAFFRDVALLVSIMTHSTPAAIKGSGDLIERIEAVAKEELARH